MDITRNQWACLPIILWVQLFRISCKDLSLKYPARQNQFIHEKSFNKGPVRRVAIALNTNSAFTWSSTENPYWYQQFDLRQSGVLSGGQPIVDFDAADICRPSVTKIEAMSFQDGITSIPIANFKNQLLLVFDLTSMQDATEICIYSEVNGEPLKLELNFTFPLEHVTQLIVLGERTSSVAVEMLGVFGKKTSKIVNVSCHQTINRLPKLKSYHRSSSTFDYVPTHDNDTFAIIMTQISNMQGEHCITMQTLVVHCFLQTFLVVKGRVFLSSNFNRWCQNIWGSIPASTVSTRYKQLFISSNSDNTSKQGFTMLKYFHSSVNTCNVSLSLM